MTHVKVVNKDSGVPQILTKGNYANILRDIPALGKKLELMFECNELGEREGEETIEAKTSDNPEMQKVIENLKQETNGEEKTGTRKGKSRTPVEKLDDSKKS